MLKKSFVFLFSFLILISFCFVGSVFAATPDMPEEMPALGWQVITDYDYIVHTRENGNVFMEVLITITSDINLDNARFYTNAEGYLVYYADVKYTKHTFQLVNGKWQDLNSPHTYKYGGDYVFGDPNTAYSQVHYSTVDVYLAKESDSIFFPATPIGSTITLEQVIAQETPLMGAKIIQAMMTILLCGVGCLALLIGLPILLKVFYRFL